MMGREVDWAIYRTAEQAEKRIAMWAKDPKRTERAVRPGIVPGGRQTVPKDGPPNMGVLKLHSGLRKAEGSVLVQTRTGRIGPAKFLHNHKLPGMLSARCRRRVGE